MRAREFHLEEMGLAYTKVTAQILRIAPYWTPKQATAVYETLDDLLALIWRGYGPQIQHVLKTERKGDAAGLGYTDINSDDVPF